MGSWMWIRWGIWNGLRRCSGFLEVLWRCERNAGVLRFAQNDKNKSNSKSNNNRSKKRLQRLKELFEELGGDGCAVFGGAADVVDGFGFADEGGAGGGYGFGSDAFVEEGLLGEWEAGVDFAQAGCADFNDFDLTHIQAGQGGYLYF